MVSGLQSKDWSVGETVIGADDIELTVNHPGHYHQEQHDHHPNGLLNTFEVRHTIDDTISGPIPMSDDLETTLEDLRDCDNDFSKFALQLELFEANGTTKYDDM
uniref:Uncharacterized protein n=2 Tax=Tetranychus urticae TaxID=32264 RepID=A0A158P4D6_TETUR